MRKRLNEGFSDFMERVRFEWECRDRWDKKVCRDWLG